MRTPRPVVVATHLQSIKKRSYYCNPEGMTHKNERCKLPHRKWSQKVVPNKSAIPKFVWGYINKFILPNILWLEYVTNLKCPWSSQDLHSKISMVILITWQLVSTYTYTYINANALVFHAYWVGMRYVIDSDYATSILAILNIKEQWKMISWGSFHTSGPFKQPPSTYPSTEIAFFNKPILRTPGGS